MKTILFDLDGTLTESREKLSEEMAKILEIVSQRFKVGIVSGSGLDFIDEQISGVFSEEFMASLLIMPCNGTKFYKWRPTTKTYENLYDSDMIDDIGRLEYNDLLARLLREQHKFMLDCPVSLDCTGKFFDYRGSMLNWSPMGRNGSKKTREDFVKFDKEEGYRIRIIEELKRFCNSQKIHVDIKLGGDTSFDIYPVGWDKTFCLQHVDSELKDIYFFGDRCFPGGNDYEISKMIGKSYQVEGPEETLKILEKFLKE